QGKLNKPFRHGPQAQRASTWGKSLDTTQAQAYVLDCFQATGSAQGIQPFVGTTDKGPSFFDLPQNLRVNLLYRFPTIHSNGLVSKITNGWWMGNIISVQSGFSFT